MKNSYKELLLEKNTNLISFSIKKISTNVKKFVIIRMEFYIIKIRLDLIYSFCERKRFFLYVCTK